MEFEACFETEVVVIGSSRYDHSYSFPVLSLQRSDGTSIKT
jgi:hypothetical protein